MFAGGGNPVSHPIPNTHCTWWPESYQETSLIHLCTSPTLQHCVCTQNENTWIEKGTATHSSILTLRIPRTEEPGGLQSIGSQKVRHAWSNLACTHIYILEYVYALFSFAVQNSLLLWLSRTFFLNRGEGIFNFWHQYEISNFFISFFSFLSNQPGS